MQDPGPAMGESRPTLRGWDPGRGGRLLGIRGGREGLGRLHEFGDGLTFGGRGEQRPWRTVSPARVRVASAIGWDGGGDRPGPPLCLRPRRPPCLPSRLSGRTLTC